MRTPWSKDGLSTTPASTTMGPLGRKSLAIPVSAPADVASATAVLRDLADETTVAIDPAAIGVTSAQVTVLLDGPTLEMQRNHTYRLEVLIVRSTGLKETTHTVIECPA